MSEADQLATLQGKVKEVTLNVAGDPDSDHRRRPPSSAADGVVQCY